VLTPQIDIARYYLDVQKGLTNPKKQVNRVLAMGQQAIYGDLAKFGDCDNGWGMVEFANGKILTTHLGRTLTNGYEAMTRVCGTKAHTVINPDSAVNRVQIRDSYGVRTTTTPDAFVLHAPSFINDLAEFADAIFDDKPLSCTPNDAYEAAKIATALQYSFRNKVPVYFDDEGLPIMEATNAKANGVNGEKFVNGANGVNGH
jgi:myo-inositol 2-dehydrogenase/D-chiro-inositol 1-dehydrogenase